MALRAPPPQVFHQVERFVPGLVGAFVHRLGFVRGVSAWTSWYRSPTENHRLGGARDSQHLWAAAVDAVGDLRAIEESARAAGLRPVRFSRHVHIQAWPAGLGRRIGLPQALGL